MSKYHNAFQGFVKAFTAAAKPGVKGSSTTIIGVAPSKNIKKYQKEKEKIIKMTDEYKKKVNDPEIKKSMNEGTSKTLGKISQILKGKKVEKKADGGRIGRRLGGGTNMAKKKTNVQKIKETFAPKSKNKNLKSVDKKKNPGLAKLPTQVRNKMGYMKKGGRA